MSRERKVGGGGGRSPKYLLYVRPYTCMQLAGF